MANLWEWRNDNPYYATAFQILDIDPTADRATARGRIAARRKRISFDAGRFPLFGRVLDLAQINSAEEQLATAETRLAHELLTHRPEAEGADLADLAELLELAESLADDRSPGEAAAAVPADGEQECPSLDYRVLPLLMPPPPGDPKPYADEETAG
ncbi:hypothetical protein GCM10027089_05190 [Nocardia thraciensis]